MSKRMERMKKFLNKYELGDAVFSKEELECISIFMHPHPSDLVCCGNCLCFEEGGCEESICSITGKFVEEWRVCNKWEHDQFKYENREVDND